MNTFNFKILGTVIFALLLAMGVILYVNGREYTVEIMEKTVEIEQTAVKKANTVWFYFTSPIDPAHPDYEDALLDESNYATTNDTEAPEDCEAGTDKVCAVRAQRSTSDPNQPDPADLIALLDEMTSPDPDQDLVILKLFDE